MNEELSKNEAKRETIGEQVIINGREMNGNWRMPSVSQAFAQTEDIRRVDCLTRIEQCCSLCRGGWWGRRGFLVWRR
jgi:hypothetical protein